MEHVWSVIKPLPFLLPLVPSTDLHRKASDFYNHRVCRRSWNRNFALIVYLVSKYLDPVLLTCNLEGTLTIPHSTALIAFPCLQRHQSTSQNNQYNRVIPEPKALRVINTGQPSHGALPTFARLCAYSVPPSVSPTDGTLPNGALCSYLGGLLSFCCLPDFTCPVFPTPQLTLGQGCVALGLGASVPPVAAPTAPAPGPVSPGPFAGPTAGAAFAGAPTPGAGTGTYRKLCSFISWFPRASTAVPKLGFE